MFSKGERERECVIEKIDAMVFDTAACIFGSLNELCFVMGLIKSARINYETSCIALHLNFSPL